MTAHDLERAVIEQLLAEKRWSRAALKVKFEDIDPAVIDGTIATLTIEGVCAFDGIAVEASRCLRYLDDHGLFNPAPQNGAPDKATLDRILAKSAAERAT